jgi:hypothetical protein
MPWNALLLPLLGGFIFISHWWRSRYFVLRFDGHRLIFYSAAAGAFFLTVSTFAILSFASLFPELEQWWQALKPFPHLAKTFLSFLLGALLWWPLNRFFHDKQREIDRVIGEKDDPLEVMLRMALGRGRLVMFSVKNGKVYVGLVVSLQDPSRTMQFIKIVPLMSGYRDKDTKVVQFTTFYPQTDEMGRPLRAFEVVLPASELQSVNLFDETVHAKYFALPKIEIEPITSDTTVTTKSSSASTDKVKDDEISESRESAAEKKLLDAIFGRPKSPGK